MELDEIHYFVGIEPGTFVYFWGVIAAAQLSSISTARTYSLYVFMIVQSIDPARIRKIVDATSMGASDGFDIASASWLPSYT